MAKTVCYIDGFNLYHAIKELKNPRLKWVNLRVLAETYLGPKDRLIAVKYFTALSTWDKEKRRTHLEYLRALELHRVTAILSNFKSETKICRTTGNQCKQYVEKQTDVAIATSMLDDAYQKASEKIILITADADQIPAVVTIKKRFPDIKIQLVTPPGRKARAWHVGSLVDDRREIQPSRLTRCLLPREVKNERGVVIATRPPKYEIVAAI